MSAPEIDDAWEQLEVLWQQLADLRVALYDANAGNFIVAPTGKLWLIDLDDVRLYRSRMIAGAILQYRWFQLCRSIRRAERTRDRTPAAVRRAA